MQSQPLGKPGSDDLLLFSLDPPQEGKEEWWKRRTRLIKLLSTCFKHGLGFCIFGFVCLLLHIPERAWHGCQGHLVKDEEHGARLRQSPV